MQVNGPKTFTSGEALAEKRLVKLSAALVVVYADAADDAVGVNDFAVGNGELCSISGLCGCNTREMTAAGAIFANADVYQADDGKIQALPVAAGTYRLVGKALEAAAGADSIIEVLPYRAGESKIVAP